MKLGESDSGKQGMQYQTRNDHDLLTISLTGELTYKDHSVFNELLESVANFKPKNVTCDLAGLEFIDSSGLGLLLLLNSQSEKTGWSLELANAGGQVAKMLQYTNIDSQISVQSQG